MKNNYKNYIKNFVIFFCINFFYGSFCLSSQEHSFDILFPKTWYEKGYNALSSTWYVVYDDIGCEKFYDHSACFEILIGRLAFAYFCIKKIQKRDSLMREEDIIYLQVLVQDLKKTFSAALSTEYVQCCTAILDKMENVLL